MLNYDMNFRDGLSEWVHQKRVNVVVRENLRNKTLRRCLINRIETKEGLNSQVYLAKCFVEWGR